MAPGSVPRLPWLVAPRGSYPHMTFSLPIQKNSHKISQRNALRRSVSLHPAPPGLARPPGWCSVTSRTMNQQRDSSRWQLTPPSWEGFPPGCPDLPADSSSRFWETPTAATPLGRPHRSNRRARWVQETRLTKWRLLKLSDRNIRIHVTILSPFVYFEKYNKTLIIFYQNQGTKTQRVFFSNCRGNSRPRLPVKRKGLGNFSGSFALEGPRSI